MTIEGMLGIGIVVVGLVLILVFAFSYTPDNRSLEERDADIQKLGGDMNSWAAGRVIRKAEINSEKDLALVERIAAAHALAHAPEVEEARHRKEMQGFELTKAQTANAISVYEAATKNGETPALREQKILTSHQITEELRKLKELAEHKVEMDFRSQMNTIRAILAYQHLSYDQFDEVRGRLIALIKEEAMIQESNLDATIKGQQLALIEEAKQMYREVMNVLKTRLLEAPRNTPGGTEALGSIQGGLGRGTVSGSQDELPVDLTWVRRRAGNPSRGSEGARTHNRDDGGGQE